MTDSSRRNTAVVGAAAVAAAAVGAWFIPSLFELCNTGVISGPTFLVIVMAIAASFGAGLWCLLASRPRRSR